MNISFHVFATRSVQRFYCYVTLLRTKPVLFVELRNRNRLISLDESVIESHVSRCPATRHDLSQMFGVRQRSGTLSWFSGVWKLPDFTLTLIGRRTRAGSYESFEYSRWLRVTCTKQICHTSTEFFSRIVSNLFSVLRMFLWSTQLNLGRPDAST